MAILCQCGCGRPVPIAKRTDTAKGWVKGQPLKMLRHHNTLSLIPWIVDPATKCWIWQRHLDREGYPDRGAYRKVYRLYKGMYPEGLQLDHTCRNRRCVNPEHLEPVTQTINVRRSSATKLTAADVSEIRRLRSSGARNKDIAALYRVSPQNIADITHGRSWKEIV